ncbi:MAG: tRNA uridine-5-carboxymethylaminomethyl(34) synthesis GTPase MnmE [Blastocatellia bacterium]|nr:MAG: tRNA uridine-5-carboxymethylaminomethyl(34) synthesis GTPase MnmE [Blastocatellia bacterium]
MLARPVAWRPPARCRLAAGQPRFCQLMFSTSDTIVAVATPAGRGGIGVVRLSGPDAHRIACRLVRRDEELRPRYATLASLWLPTGVTSETGPSRHIGVDGEEHLPHGSNGDRSVAIDHVVATYFPGPKSFTGESVVELSAHGSPVVLRAMVEAAVSCGARLAEPGEFTLRAFLNGRVDLSQAEAVADLVDAATPLQARAAFDQLQGTLTRAIGEIDAALFGLVARLEASIDFPEEGYHFVDRETIGQEIGTITGRMTSLLADANRGRLVREGLQVTIIGKPNVGKSSLFNALVGTERAIVTAVPGTTRDLLTEHIELGGLSVTLVDTAGLRETSDAVESEGVHRARHAQEVGDLTLVVLDGASQLDEMDRCIIAQTVEARRLIVANKSDVGAAWSDPAAVTVSATTSAGMEQLRAAILSALDVEPLRDPPALTNIRHIALVRQSRDALVRAHTAATASLSEEFVLADLHEARAALEEIAGRRTSDDLLAHIFSRFCVGK